MIFYVRRLTNVTKYVTINTEILETYTCCPFGFNKDQLSDIPELLGSKFNSAKVAKKFSTYMEYEDSAPYAEQPPLYNILSHLLPVQSITYRHSFHNFPPLCTFQVVCFRERAQFLILPDELAPIMLHENQPVT